MDAGSITGMNGLIIGIAKLRGMQGACLLGETSGYVVDAKSSKSLVETLLSIVGIIIDMTNLEKRAKEYRDANPDYRTTSSWKSGGSAPRHAP